MPRRKPASAKQRKAQLQEKRATKRGESPPPGPSKLRPNQLKASRRPQRSLPVDGQSSQKLQSRFIALTPEYLEKTRNLAHAVTLPRPLAASSAVFPVETMLRDGGALSCPGRPKFKYGQTKKEVERNEEGMFKKWLSAQEAVVKGWVEDEGEDEEWPRSPSWFETNLEVWRQLWRVTESSSILLLLLDSRCPPLHCPPSLRTHIQSLKTPKEVVLVLTKADLVDEHALAGWKEWVKGWWGKPVEVVSVMSYDLDYLNESGRHKPDIPVKSLEQLVEALKKAHARHLVPPERIREDPEKASKWTPSVRPSLDWESLVRHESQAGTSTNTSARRSKEEPSGESGEEKGEPLTIGLIGQPNVGKSSLLNALLGEQKVRASKTPGKTKHFQTMFWGPKKQVKMVDCPGLVCPSLVGLEMQALAGILPISQIPSLPACMYQAGRILPLEHIFRVPLPVSPEEDDQYASKKTWREPREAVSEAKKVVWTAGSIMEGRALDRGYLTAKGGRPDGNRAANGSESCLCIHDKVMELREVMRALADGRVRWGFWPPEADLSGREHRGIWLEGGEDVDDDVKSEAEETGRSREEKDEKHEITMSDYDSDDLSDEGEDSSEEADVRPGNGTADEDEEDSESEDEGGTTGGGGFFAALEEDLSESEEDEGEGTSDGLEDEEERT